MKKSGDRGKGDEDLGEKGEVFNLGGKSLEE